MKNTFRRSNPEKASKAHLHWEVKGFTDQPIVGFCKAGELFALLSIGDLKSFVLQTIAGRRQRSGSNVKLFLSEILVRKAASKCSFLDYSDERILFSNLTVLETIIFSSELRVSSPHNPAELTALRLLTVMGLDHISECRLGNIAVWERRMVLLATEIVAGMDIVLFDQPTKDLDAMSALNCITALQRVARSGKLIAITAGNLTFREYAILDRIQLLSDEGAIYFGSGSSAVSYFAQFGRTPSPGASISDFLLDLVEDLNSGYIEGTALRKMTMLQNRTISRHFERIAIVVQAKEDSEDIRVEQFERGKIPSEVDFSGDFDLSVWSRLIAFLKWIINCDCLETEEEECPVQPTFLRQFFLCLWRAFLVRTRNGNQLVGMLFLSGVLMPAGLLVVFLGLTTGPSSLANRCMLLTILPFSLVLLGAIWNEDDLKDRAVFSFERLRNYYSPFYFPLTSFIADIAVFRIFPCVVSTVVLYPILGLRAELDGFLIFLYALCMISIAGAGLCKCVFNVMAIRSDFLAPKASVVSVFILSLQLLYSGLFLDLAPLSSETTTTQPFLRRLSILHWVSFVPFSFLVFRIKF